LSEENEEMVEDTSAAAVPVQPLTVNPMDVEAVLASPRVQQDGDFAPIRD